MSLERRIDVKDLLQVRAAALAAAARVASPAAPVTSVLAQAEQMERWILRDAQR